MVAGEIHTAAASDETTTSRKRPEEVNCKVTAGAVQADHYNQNSQIQMRKLVFEPLLVLLVCPPKQKPTVCHADGKFSEIKNEEIHFKEIIYTNSIKRNTYLKPLSRGKKS